MNPRIDELAPVDPIPAGAAILVEVNPDDVGTRAYRRAVWPVLGTAAAAAAAAFATAAQGALAATALQPGASVTAATALTGNQDNFVIATAETLWCANASLLTLRGIAGGANGRRLTIVSTGAGQVDLSNQNAGSTAANRIDNGVTGTISLAAGVGRCSLVYDATAARWRVLEHEQGAWITPAFNAADFTGSGTMTWTVAAGDALSFKYLLRGRTLALSVALYTTSIGGALSGGLRIAVPAGLSVAISSFCPATCLNTGWELGVVSGLGNVLEVRLYNSAAWGAGADNKYVLFNGVFEVQ